MRSRRKAIAIVSVAVIAATVVGAALYLTFWSDDKSDEPPNAKNVRLPAPRRDEARATLAFLAGRGAPLKTMHATAGDLAPESANDCRSTADALDRSAPADRALGLISGVTDPPLRAALTEERRRLGVALTRCVRDDSEADGAVDRLQDVAEISTLRLEQLERAAR